MENNERARKAYTAMLTVTPKQPDDEEYTKVTDEVSNKPCTTTIQQPDRQLAPPSEIKTHRH